MKLNRLILFIGLTLATSIPVYPRSDFGSSFGGSLVGSFVGSAVATGVTRPRTERRVERVYYQNSDNGYQHRRELSILEQENDELRRDLRESQRIINSLHNDIGSLNVTIAQLKSENFLVNQKLADIEAQLKMLEKPAALPAEKTEKLNVEAPKIEAEKRTTPAA